MIAELSYRVAEMAGHFIQSLMTKEQGDRAKARQLLDELVTRYPKSNFLVSGRRLRAELEGAP